MTPLEPQAGREQLLHCTLERTLLRVPAPTGGPDLVVKLFHRGSLAEAQRECAVGRRLGHLDVARYLDAQTEPTTGRPCVRLEFHGGTSLDTLVAQQGALAGAEACATLLPLARTLAAMHAMRDVQAPHGLCHGDVKPSNLLRTATTTLLLDFEHAGATNQVACAGTPGFAAPEAALGVPLHPSFDVYGLGATLRWLMTGTAGDRPLRIDLDDELAMLIAACLAPSPAARPTAATVAEALADLAARLPNEPAERARACLAGGDLDGCERELAASPSTTVAAQLARRRRLLARCPELLLRADQPTTTDNPAELARGMSFRAACLRRFPQRAAAIAAARAAKELAGVMLAEQLPTVFRAVAAEDFSGAWQRLEDLRLLTRVAQRTPGALRVPGATTTVMPTVLQRAPLLCLEQEASRLEAAEREHQELLATLAAAEGALAFDDANAAVDAIASRYGGTSGAVARHRDRLHRLAFFVERIARGRGNVERLFGLVPSESATPALAFIDECALAIPKPEAETTGGTIGVRNLQLALANLHDEFPAVRARVAPGLACLDRALARVTDEAWQLLTEAQHKLAIEPVPVRPLQATLARLDTLRNLEAFVDRPQHSRSTLVDRIEWLRLRIEQAQATRDRLARGAEQALAKGHWTTGLFDMERAVTHLQSDDEGDRQAALLSQRLADVKRKKVEIESAQRRHHELTAKYAKLVDATASTTAERLAVLREHRDCLQFLGAHSTSDRGQLYANDLRDVELRMAQEQSSQAEADLDLAGTAADRCRIATDAIEHLEAFAKGSEPGTELPGRLQRLLDHWRRRLANEQRQLARERAAARSVQRRRQLVRVASAAAFVLVVVVALQWLPSPASAGESEPLQRSASTLPASLQPAANAAIAATAAGDGSAMERLAAAEHAVTALLTAAGEPDARRAAATFAQQVWHQVDVRLRTADGDRGQLARELDEATARLVALGLPQ